MKDSVICVHFQSEMRFWGLEETVLDPCCWERFMQGDIQSSNIQYYVKDSVICLYFQSEMRFWGLEETVLDPCCWDRLMQGDEDTKTLKMVKAEWDKSRVMMEKVDGMTRRQKLQLFLEEPTFSMGAQVHFALKMFHSSQYSGSFAEKLNSKEN